jgi:hypothetical protein
MLCVGIAVEQTPTARRLVKITGKGVLNSFVGVLSQHKSHYTTCPASSGNIQQAPLKVCGIQTAKKTYVVCHY